MDEIVDTFAAYRLLSLDRDPATRRPTVEVAHEAILACWVRLSAWLEESRDDLRQRRILAHGRRFKGQQPLLVDRRPDDFR